jgi:hypothetical protein
MVAQVIDALGVGKVDLITAAAPSPRSSPRIIPAG